MSSWRLLLALFALGLASLGCNAVTAKPEAEAIAERSFVARTSKDRAAMLSLYHEAFYQTISREDWTAMLDAIDTKLGIPEKQSLATWQVYVGTGDAGAGTYVTLAYEVHYPDAAGTETLVIFSSAAGDEPRIVGHHVNSPALLLR